MHPIVALKHPKTRSDEVLLKRINSLREMLGNPLRCFELSRLLGKLLKMNKEEMVKLKKDLKKIIKNFSYLWYSDERR